MYALALLRYRVPLDVVEAATESHRAYLRELKAAGTLVVSGPFVPRTGGAYVWVSRIMWPPLALISNFGAALSATIGATFWARYFPVYALGPILSTLGITFDNSTLMSWGTSFQTDKAWIFGGAMVMVVLGLDSKRQGAEKAKALYEDHSPPPPPRELSILRDRGAGRPTKFERRAIERLKGY